MMQQKINQLHKKTSLQLPNEQSDELTRLISEIQDKQKCELDKILAEADAKGKGDLLRALWQQDVKEHTEFHRDQGKNSMKIYLHVYNNYYRITQ